MDLENTQGGEVAPAEVSAQANTDAQSTTEDSAQEAPAYTPNYKFKVHDQEHEFDEAFRPFVSNADMEKRFRDLYERAYGLDHIKPKYEKTRAEYQQLSQNWNTVSQDLQKVGMFLHNKDFTNFFKTFNLQDSDIFEYALSRLQYHELPPEKRAQLEKQQSQSEEYVRLQQENARLRERFQNDELSQLNNSLNSEISSPNVQTVATAFDARAGKPGAFREAVIHHANVVFSSSGKDMNAQEAVHSFMNMMGLASAQPAMQAQSVVGQQTSQTAQRPQTLPKMQSSGGSPVKPTVKSIDDLKKIRAAMTE